MKRCGWPRFERDAIEWPSQFLRLDQGVCTLTDMARNAVMSLISTERLDVKAADMSQVSPQGSHLAWLLRFVPQDFSAV